MNITVYKYSLNTQLCIKVMILLSKLQKYLESDLFVTISMSGMDFPITATVYLSVPIYRRHCQAFFTCQHLSKTILPDLQHIMY